MPWHYPLAALAYVSGFRWNLQFKENLKGTVPPLWMGKLRPGKDNHLPKSQDKFGAELDLGVYLPEGSGGDPMHAIFKAPLPRLWE